MIETDNPKNNLETLKPTWQEHIFKQTNVSLPKSGFYKMMLKNITPRLYQETVLATCVNKNCLVVLPTGLGKTVIALMLSSQRLKTFPNSKVLFLAPTRPLVDQHLETFNKHFDISPDDLAVFTGHIKPDKRAELWNSAKIVFSTPQGMENDIISGRISLEDVSLVIFDEAHRATGEYAYNFIAKQYDKFARYPRILALTASPGADIDKIRSVCSNLFIEAVELRTDKDHDVAQYIQKTDVNWVHINFPEEFRMVQKYLKTCYNSKITTLKELNLVDVSKISSKSGLLKAQAFLQGQLAKGMRDFESMRAVSVIAELMKIEHAIELLETQGLNPLITYFDKLFSDSKSTKVKAVLNLVSDSNFKSAYVIAKRLFESNIEHPKIPKLRNIISSQLTSSNKTKIIVFTQFRDTGMKILESLNTINGVSANFFVGQAKKNGVGLSQKKQKEMLDEFRNGDFNVLVATSVAEEGIDIPCVDLVVFYEPVPSGIRTIQRRGRTGRQDSGAVKVLVTKGTRDEAYKWSAHHKENRMYRELNVLKKEFHAYERPQNNSLTNYIQGNSNMKIYADVREKGAGVIKELADLNFFIELKTLEVADYILSDKVGVEYKKVGDFVDSIIDGRILEQVKQLKNSFEKPLIIIEGEEDMYSQRNINPNSIRGMISTISVSYGVPIFQTKNIKDTAALFSVIAKREQENNKSHTYTAHLKKPMTLRERQEYIVSSLPGVGSILSKPLLERFGSVSAVLNASEEDLKKIDKIGELKAKEIRNIVESKYDI